MVIKANKTELPKAKKMAQEVDKLLYYPGTYNKNDSYHFSQEMPDFMKNKLSVTLKDDMAEIAVKIKRHWIGIPSTVKAKIDLKSADETQQIGILENFKKEVKSLTDRMNSKYGADPDSAVFSPW